MMDEAVHIQSVILTLPRARISNGLHTNKMLMRGLNFRGIAVKRKVCKGETADDCVVGMRARARARSRDPSYLSHKIIGLIDRQSNKPPGS